MGPIREQAGMALLSVMMVILVLTMLGGLVLNLRDVTLSRENHQVAGPLELQPSSLLMAAGLVTLRYAAQAAAKRGAVRLSVSSASVSRSSNGKLDRTSEKGD